MKQTKNIVYIILILLSIIFAIFLLKHSFYYTGFFFLFGVVWTILYYLKFAYKNISALPSILLLYIFLSFFFLIPADIWNIGFEDGYEETQVQQDFFIPPPEHRLYPVWGFKQPWILEDDFEVRRTQEQESKSFTGNTFEIYKWFQ